MSLKHLVAAAAVAFSTGAGAEIKLPGATGGILRFPNTNQAEDDGNFFAEAWVKQGAILWEQGDSKLQAFYLGNYVRDSHPYPWNNSTRHGIGLQLSTRPAPHLELTFSARHDWYWELGSDVQRDGWRFAVDYYYYRYFPKDDRRGKALTHVANIF